MTRNGWPIQNRRLEDIANHICKERNNIYPYYISNLLRLSNTNSIVNSSILRVFDVIVRRVFLLVLDWTISRVYSYSEFCEPEII